MKLKKGVERTLWQWRMMEYLSYILVFLTPLIFSNPNNWFVFNPIKIDLIIGITLLMLILYGWGLIVKKDWSFRITPLHIVALIFLFVLTWSSILGVDPLNSFFGRWREGISLILIYTLAIFAFLIGFLAKKDKSFLPRLLLFSFMGSIGVAIVSYTGGSWSEAFREGASTIGNSSYVGAYLLFNVLFGVGLLFYYSKLWKKIAVSFGVLIVLLSPILFNQDILLGKIGFSQIISQPFLLLGYANGAVVGLAISFIVIISFFLIFSSKKAIKIIGVIIFFIFLSSILYIGNQLVNPASSIHRIYVEQKGENRFIAWEVAENSLVAHPFLGSGFNNFSYNYQKYFTTDIFKLKIPELYFNQPHNVVWEYASNNGAIGLVAFLSLLFFTFLSFFKHKEDELIHDGTEAEKRIKIFRIIFIGILFGYFIQNLFVFDTPMTYLMLFLVVGIAIGESEKEWICMVSNKNYLSKILGGTFIFFGLISIILFVILPMMEINKLNEIKSTDSIKREIELRQKVQEVSLFGGVNDSVYMAGKFYDLYNENISKINKSNKDLYLEDIQSIINQVKEDIKKQPYEVQGYIIISRLLNMGMFINGKVDEEKWNESFDGIKKALDLNHLNPEIYILLSQTYIMKGDFTNAFLSMRQALVIAPTYTKSYEYVKKLLKIKPDNNFKKYVEVMERKWVTR